MSLIFDRYTSNISKGFAITLSIVLSCAGSVWLFNFELSPNFTIGAYIVALSTLLYSMGVSRMSKTGIPKVAKSKMSKNYVRTKRADEETLAPLVEPMSEKS